MRGAYSAAITPEQAAMLKKLHNESTYTRSQIVEDAIRSLLRSRYGVEMPSWEGRKPWASYTGFGLTIKLAVSPQQSEVIDDVLAEHQLSFAQLFEAAMEEFIPLISQEQWPTANRAEMPFGRPRAG